MTAPKRDDAPTHRYSVESAKRTVIKPWGKEDIYTRPDAERVGKILTVRGGQKLSFQYHDAKQETLCLLSGKALIWLETAQGDIEKVPMEPHAGYDVLPMQKHRIEALEDSVIIEVSSPERGITVRISDDFGRPDETDDVRAEENRGWNGSR